MGANQNRAFFGADSQPVQKRLALVVVVDVMPAERNEIALEQLTDGEGVPGRAFADQPFQTVALGNQPLATHNHGAQEEVAELRGTGDHPAQFIGSHDQHRRLLGNDASGERRLAREHRDVGSERPWLTLSEVVIAVGLAVDDVDRSREDDEERRIALSLLEEDLAWGE